MRGKLITVAEDLVVPIEEAARAEAEDADLVGARTPTQPTTRGRGDTDDARRPSTLATRISGCSKDESLQLPDLASIDLDFDEPDE